MGGGSDGGGEHSASHGILSRVDGPPGRGTRVADSCVQPLCFDLFISLINIIIFN